MNFFFIAAFIDEANPQINLSGAVDDSGLPSPPGVADAEGRAFPARENLGGFSVDSVLCCNV